MKTIKTLTALAVPATFLLTTILSAQDSVPAPTDPNVVAIQTVIGQIRDALIRVQKDLENEKLPALASVDLTLKTG